MKPDKKKRRDRPQSESLSGLPYGYHSLFGSVVSSNECTGLTATTPEDDYEAEAYRDIYDVPVMPDEDAEKIDSHFE